MNAAITGEQYTIAAGPYRAVVTELGGGLRELSHDGRPLVLPYGADELPPGAAGQLLVPWPNRIDHGRYEFGGDTHVLAVDEPERDTAIHGLARWQPWTLTGHEPHRVRLACRLLGRPGYPFRLDLAVEYALGEDGLTVTMAARNTGARPAPYGHGAHPYLTLGRPVDECELTVPAGRYLPVDDRGVPDGAPRDVEGTPFDLRRPRSLDGVRIDNAFTGLRREPGGRAWVRLADGTHSVSLWADETHPWLEIYTGDGIGGGRNRSGVGVEPMTCPPNAFVSGTDLIVLRPGEEVTGSWGITAS